MTSENRNSIGDLEYSDEAVKRAEIRLKKIMFLSSQSISPSWQEDEIRIGHFGPWGHQQFRTIQVEKNLTPEEKQALMNHAKFSLWLELRDYGYESLANDILGRRQQEQVFRKWSPL